MFLLAIICQAVLRVILNNTMLLVILNNTIVRIILNDTILLALLTLVFSQTASASGFTFLSSVAHKLHIPEHNITFVIIALSILIIGLIY